MEISGIDKLKVNNAVIVFLIIIVCLFFPLLTLIVIDYKLFFDYDLLKMSLAVMSYGFSQFAIVYAIHAIDLRRKYVKDDHLNEDMVAFLLRNPLPMTIGTLIFLYTFFILIIHTMTLNLHYSLNLFIGANFSLMLAGTIDQIFKRLSKKKPLE